MGKPTIAFILRAIGVIDMIIGGFIEFWLLTIGLYIVFYSFDMNKTPSDFVYLFLALVFGVLFIIGGIGILCKRPWSRIYLNTAWGLSILLLAFYIFMELRSGFSADGIGSEYFYIGSWLGGIIFCSFMAALGVLHIRFLNSSTVKDYLTMKGSDKL